MEEHQELVQSEDLGTRTRTLSEKGRESFRERRDKFNQEIEYLWSLLESLLQETDSRPDNTEPCLAMEQRIAQLNANYISRVNAYSSFLKGTKTEESTQNLEALSQLTDIRKRAVNRALNLLKDTSQYDETRSTRSHNSGSKGSSRSSACSNITSIARQKRAKAEAARAAIIFAEKQAELERLEAMSKKEAAQRKAAMDEETARRKAIMDKETAITALRDAEIRTEMNLLQTKKELAIAEAEARVYEMEETGSQVLDDDPPQQPGNNFDRVNEFVSQQSEVVLLQENTENQDELPKRPLVHFESSMTNCLSPTTSARGAIRQELGLVQFNAEETELTPSSHTGRQGPLVPHATQRDLQGGIQQVTLPNASLDNGSSEVTRFLLRKDLLFSQLTKYNDKPESYYAWKESFKCVVEELCVTDSEQINLLVKWLGPESSEQALSIRSSNAGNPSRGLKYLWERLDERYGSPEMVEASLKRKLETFPKLTNRDTKQLYDFLDLLSEVQFLKEKHQFRTLLGYFDSSTGVRPLVSKLPYSLQEKWSNRAAEYAIKHSVAFPPFNEFHAFVKHVCRIRNNPGFRPVDLDFSSKGDSAKSFPGTRTKVNARKTDVAKQTDDPPTDQQLDHCVLHRTNHTLDECRGFKSRSIEERKKLLRQHNICYRCCASDKHVSRDCRANITCNECGSKQHTTALHINRYYVNPPVNESVADHGGESPVYSSKQNDNEVRAKCTEICKGSHGKSCAKILPVNVYHKDNPNKILRLYAIIDDQSNRSLALPSLFDFFDVQSKAESYTLNTCSGRVITSGRRGKDFVVESINGEVELELPTLIECDNIPDDKSEIPTPEVVKHHEHLNDLRGSIKSIDRRRDIMLLIGRDLAEAHYVLDQRLGKRGMLYAQRLKLGWVIIGEACLHKQHAPDNVNVNRTHVSPSGQSTNFMLCDNYMEIREQFSNPPCKYKVNNKFDSSIFERTKDDDKPGMSQEDRAFMKQMNNEFQIDSAGHWVAPLPFKTPRPRLPNNESQARRRAQFLDTSLKKNTTKREHFIEFMAKILDNHHAEVAPPLGENEECWYLPLFGVYHPKKPNQIRGVFDSTAKYQGVSLNDVLLTGPDLTNNLLGVLLRFRKEMEAVTADVQHMFHCFIVREDHRNYLRFYWYEDNDINKRLIEYRMRVHVFGNSPSPAIATLGMRKAVLKAEPEYGSHVSSFVCRDFYVDDGLTSCPTPEEAIKLLKDTQNALKNYGNLRLHKIASNSPEVMAAFPTGDLASNLKDLDLDSNDKPLQRSLGLIWDVNQDYFLFDLSPDKKPATRRGILSTINSIFDPLGFLSPVIIYGKLLLRDIVSETVDWDQPLSEDIASKWETWNSTLQPLKNFRIPRTYVPQLSNCVSKELHVYSDASEKAIAAVVYLRTKDRNDKYHVGFVLGKTKVAPQTGTTIPRKELCAAVLAVEIAQFATEQLDTQVDSVYYYTDSKVVLGYICNSTRRFYVYVANRVEKIRKFSNPDQWNYVPTDQNPADSATRSLLAAELQTSDWLNGPKQLLRSISHEKESHELVMPDDDNEIRCVTTMIESKERTPFPHGLGAARFERFSSWKNLIAGITFLRRVARSRKCGSSNFNNMKEDQTTEDLILRTVQDEFYGKEMKACQIGKQISKQNPLTPLNPTWDTTHNIICVGGRLRHFSENIDMARPIIVPGNSHIATLLVRHYHERVKHQGRHITEGAVRSAGYWITSGKRLISSVIHKCVTCRKLRRETQHQIMADLPPDRLEPGPPFTNVGVDVFGPWSVLTRKTRAGSAISKRWAVLFTCLVTRAVHIEVIEEMTSSSFINALRRFTAIRGPVKLFRSDQGTNFTGAVDDLQINHGPIRDHLKENGTEWKFNPPHSSHMGGAWERMIGTARRILDVMLAEAPSKKFLTHEVLSTFMAEVCAIINSRPLTPISTDPENPLILTPAMLLTQKIGYTYRSDELVTTCQVDLYRSQWKRVQALAQTFWSRWRKEYLPLLWTTQERNLTEGDVVLMKDNSVCRNRWPVGIITKAIKGSDDHVRKAEVRIVVGEKCEPKIYTRPITELVLLD